MGAITAIFAAIVAVAQTDIKKVLAYSTVSQLGYMFLAAGCGAYTAAIFHVVTHAFFKALLFLAAGSVILALHHEQDTDRMGGLWRRLPWTHATFAVGVAAISGFPFFSGFFSKDEILLAALEAQGVPGHLLLYGIAAFTAALTAFYMCRLHFRTFLGESRLPAELRDHAREPGRTILVPLFVLAALSILGGWLGPSAALNPFPVDAAHSNSLANFLSPALVPAAHEADAARERWLAVFATSLATAGALLAYFLYVSRPELPGRVGRALGGLRRLVERKFYVDELYDAAVVRPLVALSDAFLYRRVDAGWIDGALVGGSAQAVRALAADVLRHLQSGLAQSYLLLIVLGAAAMVGWMLR